MFPYIAFNFKLFIPSKIEHSPIISGLRVAINAITKKATGIVADKAPGTRLKHDLTTTYQETPTGAVGEVWMPFQLKFTLPPGVQSHFIPGGLAVSSYPEASRIQQERGYPMSFYWEKVGAVVHRWSVYHPGQKGQKWGEEVTEDVSTLLQEATDKIFQRAAEIWGAMQ